MDETVRKGLSYDERWGNVDLGLITSWERGREMSLEKPDLAKRALSGELPILPWRGGFEKANKKKSNYGALNYLAMWQGLRGEDLNIDVDKESILTCTATGMAVVFTSDLTKFSE